ncbi:hypothetical protein CW705_01445 [Candidatus Bathyarchaeota archaeon]|nr:MAG: hypothetical protein CW705_01445 [Candidatus Bathyarchaeota archaeon]
MNPRPPPCEGPNGIDWDLFKEWLFKEFSPKTAQDRLRYSRKFSDCLLKKDFSELRLLSDDKRVHVLKALSALSKFLGVYDEFKGLVRNYGLKWTGRNGDDLIIARLTRVVDADEILEWIRSVKAACPDYAGFMDLIAATGLRYEEAVNCWNLIIGLSGKSRLEEYYRAEAEVLEHFRFKDLFIRRSKKAFISFAAEDFIEKITRSKPLSAYVLPNRIKRRGLRQRFSDIREFHASVLTRYLRQPEIDFIHGRVSTSVFMRNYFNPAWIQDLKERALKAAGEILEKIA